MAMKNEHPPHDQSRVGSSRTGRVGALAGDMSRHEIVTGLVSQAGHLSLFFTIARRTSDPNVYWLFRRKPLSVRTLSGPSAVTSTAARIESKG